MENILGLSYPIITLWLRRFRKALPKVENILDGNTEVDGSFFGPTNHIENLWSAMKRALR